uniref:DUF834 domain-containing protein n=1 Tax=Oryza meridionalis TaxID=40149 RepID=A0A0E0CZB1_9ORYZ
MQGMVSTEARGGRRVDCGGGLPRVEADGGCSLPRFAVDASHIWRRSAAVADGAFSRSEEEWKRIAADG